MIAFCDGSIHTSTNGNFSLFVENFINFLGVSLTLFAVAHLYMFVSHNKIIKPTVRCKYCKQFISVEVNSPDLSVQMVLTSYSRDAVTIARAGRMGGKICPARRMTKE